ncbi:hypothetical protein ACWDYH_24860 [Nocardia goodfellowii]
MLPLEVRQRSIEKADVERKDKIALTVATVAMIGTIVSSGAAGLAYLNSSEANRIAREAADMVARDTSSPYFGTIALVWRKDGQLVRKLANQDKLPIALSPDEAKADSWIEITITNVGNRTVTLTDIGLIYDREANLGQWRTAMSFRRSDYCKSDNDEQMDVRCFDFPVVIPVGAAYTFEFPLLPYIDDLRHRNAASPIVGINRREGSDYFMTTISIK